MVAEWIRSEINVGSERSLVWDPLAWLLWRKKSKRKQYVVRLSHSTVHRLVQRAGGRARAMRGKYGEVKGSGVLGCDETGIIIKGIAAGLQVLARLRRVA